jgi:hypothetical protein
MLRFTKENNNFQPKHLRHQEIDKGKWDACIESSHNCLIYALSWYLDIVSPNWEALVLGDYKVVMPLPVKSKFGLRYLIRPYFCQQLGIFSSKPLSESIIKSFLSFSKSLFRYSNFHLNYSNNSDVTNQTDAGITYVLQLGVPYSNLNKNYSTNTQRNIKKALQNDVKYFHSADANLFFQLYKKHGKFNDGKRFWHSFENLIEMLLFKGVANISYAEFSGNIECAILWVKYNKRVIYLVACNSPLANEMRLNFLMIDSFIKEYAGKDLILDFEGSKIQGLARFYASFGSQPEYFPVHMFNSLPFPLNIIKS